MADETFSDAPFSFGEMRAESGDARSWTPRDLLVHLLRKIDRGEFDPKIMSVVYKLEDAKTALTCCGSRHAQGTLYERVGLLQTAIHDILASS